MKCTDFIADQHEALSLMVLNEVLEPMKNLQKQDELQRAQIYAEITKLNASHEKEKEVLSKVCHAVCCCRVWLTHCAGPEAHGQGREGGYRCPQCVRQGRHLASECDV